MAPRSREQPDIEIARRIRAKRIERRFTQAELASHLNMTAQNLQKYEAGRQRISATILAEIASFLATPVSWFFDAARDALASTAGAQGHRSPDRNPGAAAA